MRVWKRLRDDEHVYGFGEKTGRLNKRGRKLGGYSYTMWNSDTFALRERHRSHLRVDPVLPRAAQRARRTASSSTTPSAATSTSAATSQGLLSFGAEGGELDYYFIYGPDAEARGPALHASSPAACRCRRAGRSAITSAATATTRSRSVRFIADNFRERRIPADVIWLDIHYQDGYKPVHLGPRALPRSRAADRRPAARQASTSSPIVDAHPKKEAGLRAVRHRPRRRSLREEPGRHASTRRRSGRRRRRRIPAPSVFPDFSKPAARDWWGGLYKIAHRHRRRRHLERHERAGGVRDRHRHDAARRAPRRRGPADRPSRDPQRLRPAE